MAEAPAHVLDVSVVRVLAFLMAVAFAAGVVSFSRKGRVAGGRHPAFRVEDNPPAILQAAWPLLTAIPGLYPFVVAAVPQVTYGTPLNFSFPLDAFGQVFGFLLWGLGGLLAMWSVRALGRFMVLQIAVAEDHELIKSGPYALMRHPAYAAVTFMALGATLLFLSYVLLAVTVLVVLIATYRARREERLLSSTEGFGDEYRAYMSRTGRFLPVGRRR